MEPVTGMARKSALLINLPTFPKGFPSLGLGIVGEIIGDYFDVELLDLNLVGIDSIKSFDPNRYALIGISVSSQNFGHAKEVSSHLRQALSSAGERPTLVWGGQLPTLLPEEALKYADSIVEGSFEPIASAWIQDFLRGRLEKRYRSDADFDSQLFRAPKRRLFQPASRYYKFMGVPMETSRGCNHSCTFCMVRVMQTSIAGKSNELLRQELDSLTGQFVNVVDYNIGADRNHLLRAAEQFRSSGITGWMAETCIENLDDTEVLEALRQSGCRLIYCGLESIDDDALSSVNKRFNKVSDYERVIRKVQAHGIDIASGMILGLRNTTPATFQRTLEFFSNMNLLYVKLTFLTFNPGTKVSRSMLKFGNYTSEKVDDFDGNRLVFQHAGVDPDVIFDGARDFIRRFYSLRAILRRSRHIQGEPLRRLEFCLLAYCYSIVYRSWLKNDVLSASGGRLSLLIERSFSKSLVTRLVEWLLERTRAERASSGKVGLISKLRTRAVEAGP